MQLATRIDLHTLKSMVHHNAGNMGKTAVGGVTEGTDGSWFQHKKKIKESHDWVTWLGQEIGSGSVKSTLNNADLIQHGDLRVMNLWVTNSAAGRHATADGETLGDCESGAVKDSQLPQTALPATVSAHPRTSRRLRGCHAEYWWAN